MALTFIIVAMGLQQPFTAPIFDHPPGNRKLFCYFINRQQFSLARPLGAIPHPIIAANIGHAHGREHLPRS